MPIAGVRVQLWVILYLGNTKLLFIETYGLYLFWHISEHIINVRVLYMKGCDPVFILVGNSSDIVPVSFHILIKHMNTHTPQQHEI